MTQEKFISLIDARFPYCEPKKARALAERALKISPGAVFMVYHELARPCRSVKSPPVERLEILEYLEERFVHPLSGLASWLTCKAIVREQLGVKRIATIARIIAAFPGSYGILDIAYFCCDDKRGKNEALFNSIRASWEKLPAS